LIIMQSKLMLSSLGVASAYMTAAPVMRSVRTSATKMAFVDDLEGVGEETGGEVWDPLGISASVSDEAVMWFRHAELKHGRAAMLATVGYLTNAMGLTFPGDLANGVSFASVGANGPYAAWSAVPTAGKLQILSLIFMLELASESKKPHDMRGGVPGKIDSLPFDGITGIWAPKIKFWDPLNFTGALSAEQLAKKRKAELKNGRLAMIGIMSFVASHEIPGSVPAVNF